MADKDADRLSVDRRSFIRALGEQALLSVGSALALGHELREEVIGQLREEEPRPRPADGGEATMAVPWLAARMLPDASEEPLGGWVTKPAVASWLQGNGVMRAVDQRSLPEPGQEIELRTVGQVIQAMRVGIIDGGLGLSQAGVQALALAAMSAGAAPRSATLATLRGAARALAGARPDVPLVRDVVEAVLTDAAAAVEEPLASRLCGTVDVLTRTIQTEHAQLARRGAEWLDRAFGTRVCALVTGEFGPQATGSIGTTSAILRSAADRGTSIDAWVPAGMPSGRSQAILSAALADTPVTVHAVSDVRIGTLLLERRVQIVILGASWVDAVGSLAGEVGSRTIAVLAKEAGIPVIGVASGSMVLRPGSNGWPVAVREREDRAVPLELVDGRWLTGILGETGLRPALVADGPG